MNNRIGGRTTHSRWSPADETEAPPPSGTAEQGWTHRDYFDEVVRDGLSAYVRRDPSSLVQHLTPDVFREFVVGHPRELTRLAKLLPAAQKLGMYGLVESTELRAAWEEAILRGICEVGAQMTPVLMCKLISRCQFGLSDDFVSEVKRGLYIAGEGNELIIGKLEDVVVLLRLLARRPTPKAAQLMAAKFVRATIDRGQLQKAAAPIFAALLKHARRLTSGHHDLNREMESICRARLEDGSLGALEAPAFVELMAYAREVGRHLEHVVAAHVVPILRDTPFRIETAHLRLANLAPCLLGHGIPRWLLVDWIAQGFEGKLPVMMRHQYSDVASFLVGISDGELEHTRRDAEPSVAPAIQWALEYLSNPDNLPPRLTYAQAQLVWRVLEYYRRRPPRMVCETAFSAPYERDYRPNRFEDHAEERLMRTFGARRVEAQVPVPGTGFVVDWVVTRDDGARLPVELYGRGSHPHEREPVRDDALRTEFGVPRDYPSPVIIWADQLEDGGRRLPRSVNATIGRFLDGKSGPLTSQPMPSLF